MNLPHTVDVVGEEDVVSDEDGNGCDCCRLVDLWVVKRQIRRWQDEYAFDYAWAMSMLSEDSTTAMAGLRP